MFPIATSSHQVFELSFQRSSLTILLGHWLCNALLNEGRGHVDISLSWVMELNAKLLLHLQISHRITFS